MKNEPKLFKVLSLIFLLFGLSYPFWGFNGKQLSLSLMPVDMQVTDYLLFISFIGLSASFYYSWVKTHLVYMTNIFLVIVNFMFSVSNENFHSSITPLVIGIFYYSLYLVFTQSKEFVTLVNQNKQWWKVAPRITAKIDSTLYIGRDQIKLQTADISETGVMLKMENPNAFKKYHALLGENVKVELALDSRKLQFVDAQIVRLNLTNSGSKGVALNFTKKTEEFNHSLKNFITNTQKTIKDDIDRLSSKIESELCL